MLADTSTRPMNVEVERHPEYAILRIREPYLNFTVGPELRSLIQEITSEGMYSLILDMADVNSTDSSGLSAFVAANRICQENGGLMLLLNAGKQIERLIDLARLADVLRTETDLETAKARILKHRAANSTNS